jgi:Holliday junction resolvasome RuvABC endonuclease subunit
MKVLALDQATQTGWTIGGDKVPLPKWTSGRFRAPKRDQLGERLIIVHDSVLALIEEHQPDMLALEQVFDPVISSTKSGDSPAINYNSKTVSFLQKLMGAVEMAAARHSIPYDVYTSRAWRSTLKLPHKPPTADSKWIKRVTLRKVLSMGAKVGNEDEADSWGICYHALHGAPAARRAQGDLMERAELL